MATPDTQNLAGSINAVEFRISYGSPALSENKQNVEIPYVGVGNPSQTASLSVAQYSSDDGTTWRNMTAVAGTVITGLAFTASGTAHSFAWAAKTQLEANSEELFNVNIRLRLQATTGVITTDMAAYNLFLARTQQNLATAAQGSQFPDDYSGVPGNKLLDNAPKPV